MLDRQKKLAEMINSNYSYKEMADKLGITVNAVKKRIARLKKQDRDIKDVKIDNNPSQNSISKEFDKDKCTINSKSDRLRTVEDVLEYAEIDTSIWEVERVKMNTWEMPRKNKKVDLKWKDGSCNGTVTDEGDFHIAKMWQITITLKKIVKNNIEDVFKSLTNDLYQCPNKFKTPVLSNSNKTDKNLLEISLVDHHFGKLCLDGKGLDYSRNTFLKAVDNLLNKSHSFNIDRILMPVGSDFFHIDNIQRTTSGNTPQDVDGHFFDVYKEGCKSLIQSIQFLSSHAPVDLLWVPGNHDFSTSFFLCEYLKAWFNENKYVNVDTDKKSRKYYQYGTNLIGFTHGNEEKHETLARLIMAENLSNPKINEVKYFEYHIGHKHTKKASQYIAGDLGNVRIIELPSLAGTDYWHYKKGFIGSRKAAESYIYNKEHGNLARFSCNISEIE